ncbi:hypothetical protein NW754_014330 [Fusarium falciforme]|uniref:Uncharacterized protein n=1 Tax=Fusarium falciforme TaxID=195108 RepID=A0A9W8QZ54_9HYPO|nr:hypothetical protein NW754_014330 [Fusarium falciforme]KAJ4180892.1 hypothetical protein NW755_011427 [Fusarium falciforme]KAJ4249628.1 hypothetical protein NW757_007653 [Fusarium falciforme]
MPNPRDNKDKKSAPIDIPAGGGAKDTEKRAKSGNEKDKDKGGESGYEGDDEKKKKNKKQNRDKDGDVAMD